MKKIIFMMLITASLNVSAQSYFDCLDASGITREGVLTTIAEAGGSIYGAMTDYSGEPGSVWYFKTTNDNKVVEMLEVPENFPFSQYSTAQISDFVEYNGEVLISSSLGITYLDWTPFEEVSINVDTINGLIDRLSMVIDPETNVLYFSGDHFVIPEIGSGDFGYYDGSFHLFNLPSIAVETTLPAAVVATDIVWISSNEELWEFNRATGEFSLILQQDAVFPGTPFMFSDGTIGLVEEDLNTPEDILLLGTYETPFELWDKITIHDPGKLLEYDGKKMFAGIPLSTSLDPAIYEIDNGDFTVFGPNPLAMSTALVVENSIYACTGGFYDGAYGVDGSGGCPIARMVLQTSVEETEGTSDLTLHPNPTTGLLTIESTDINVVVKIINATGQMVKTFEIVSVKTEIDISDLPNGLYWVGREAILLQK